MAFNADEYMGVIVKQIADNFIELHDVVEACEKLAKKEKKFRTTYDTIKYLQLDDDIQEQKSKLPDVICSKYRSIEPLSVGLFGEWGSGKTHLLKLIEAKINTIQLDEKDNDKKTFPRVTIPIFFNAWRFEKEEHMIIPLFETMLAQLEEYEHIPLNDSAITFVRHSLVKLKVLGKALKKGLQIPRNLGELPTKIKNLDATVVSDVLNTEAIGTEYEKKIKEELVDDELFKALTEESRLESVYYKIPKWIEKITISDKINFVFLIDDLDRCLPENTLKMLESIKLFLDVPSCAFVLAIDDDVVERGVTYHYRDYLQQNNNNIIINLDKNEVKKQESKVTELPITGHEYLEKMIQLPFRIPVISEDNMYGFLEERYRSSFEKILKDKQEEKVDIPREYKEGEGSTPQQSQTDMILDFFSRTIPPKPRKIKRTAMLFETKVNLLTSLGIELRPKLIAKMTLLELFAPKLLRFMQNNGYARIYDRLVHFRNIDITTNDENEKNKLSLADIAEIRQHIDSKDADYKTKEKEIFHKLMDIVTESRGSRMVFDLDAIFDTTETAENLQLNVELMKPPKKNRTNVNSKLTYLSESSLEKLFRPNDAASWADAFRDNKLLAKSEALLSQTELNEIIRLAKEKVEFAKDPEWMGIVATYIDDRQYIELLKELYSYRFINIKDKFEMGMYQVTFAEYDRYCQVKDVEAKKTKDREWGRGKRPVIYVSWNEATEYARWLTNVLDDEYTLPSEEEWYLACNNGKDTKWHFGDEEKELKEYAWYSENSENKTHPIGEKKSNALGLYDMHGNVWEWCKNWYDDEEKYKELRGGSWGNFSYNSGSSSRYRNNPSISDDDIGFRLQRTLRS